MKNFSISNSLSQAWDFLKTNILLVVIFFITFIPSMCAQGSRYVFNLTDFSSFEDVVCVMWNHLIPFIGVCFVLQIISYFLQAGFFNACLTVVKGGKAEFHCFDMPFGTYVKFACAIICYTILTSVGIGFCIIPGIIFAIRFAFVPTIVLDDPYCGFADAFQRSWDMTRGNFWNLFAFFLVVILLYVIGFLCCCVGIYVAAPLCLLAQTVIYMKLRPEEDVIIEEETM